MHQLQDTKESELARTRLVVQAADRGQGFGFAVLLVTGYF